MELVIWILFILISLIFQAIKKRKGPVNQPDFEAEGEAPPTLQDALREIQEALQQGSRPAKTEPARQDPISHPVQVNIPERKEYRIGKGTRQREESEFRGLERPREREVFAEDEFEKKRRREMDLRRQEIQRKRKERQKALQHTSDSYAKSTPSDPLSLELISKEEYSDVQRFKKIIKNKKQLQDAFLFNEILGTPVALRGRRRS